MKEGTKEETNSSLVLTVQVVPLYCFDPRQLGTTPWGNRKMGNLRAQFLLESVLDLKAGLRGVGSDLVVHLGKPEDAIPGANSLGEPLISFPSCEHHLAAECTT